jgi:hypothetical protein
VKLVQPFSDNILPYLERYEFRIAAAGVRYGSVAYISFGSGFPEMTSRGTSLVRYPVAIEFGADDWVLFREGKEILNSSFEDRELARAILARHMIGKTLTAIEMTPTDSTLSFDGGLGWTSRLSEDPASGFLYSFDVDGGPSWETVDGVSVVEEP